jgi:hypothetical protein
MELRPMTTKSNLIKKLPLILIGIVIGLFATYLLDTYRENQSELYVENVFSHIKQPGRIDWENDDFVKGFNAKSINIIKKLGSLEEYTITANDTSYNFNNDLGLHPVAFVTADAEYQKGAIEIMFNLYKKNGKWVAEKIIVKKKKS